MTDADEKSNKVIKLKKRISEELNEIDKDIKGMEKSKKDSVEKIEIKKVELKKYTSTQEVCDEHYATLQEIEQASKLIEERKTSITALDSTIANLDLQISQIQSDHDKAVAQLEKKRRRLNDYLKYYEDLNDKLEKLIELLGEEEKKHCIELNNLKVERAKTLARTDLSEDALNKVLKDLDNKMVVLNKEHGKLIDSISQKLSEITIDASEVEELLSKDKKKAPAKKKEKGAGEAADDEGTTTEDAIGDEASEVTDLPVPAKVPMKAPSKPTRKAATVEDEAPADEVPDEDIDGEKPTEEKKVEKEKPKKEKEEKTPEEQPDESVEEGVVPEEKEEAEEEKVKQKKAKVAPAEKTRELKKDFKAKFSMSMPMQQFQPRSLVSPMDQEAAEDQLDDEQEKEVRTDDEFDSDYRPLELEDWEPPVVIKSKKKEKKKKASDTPKKPKKKKGKKKAAGDDEDLEEEVEEEESLDEELLDWFASKEKDIRSDLLRQGLQITPSNRIITKDDRVISLKQAQRLGLLHDYYDEGAEEEEEEELGSSVDDFGLPGVKKKKARDKQVKYYKSPASSASTLGKESSESHICGRDMEYLKVVFGKSLTIALAEITAVQPTDPIHYLAHWMLKYRYNQEIDQITRIQIQELMIEQERLAAEKWHRELQEEARLAVLEALFRAENIIIQQDFQSELQLREYEGEFEESTPTPAKV